MIGAMPATYGDPVVAHPSTGCARRAPLQGRERHAGAGTWCVRTARGARRARGGRKVQFYRPAGAIFTRARRAVQYERDEIDELLGLRVLLLKMDAAAAAVAVCLH